MERKIITTIKDDGFLIQSKCSDLSDDQILKIESLIEAIWPNEATDKDRKTRLSTFRKQNKSSEVFLVEMADKLAGHTKITSRTIYAGTKPIEVTALSGVCVMNDFRDYGFGKSMIIEVFKLIDQGQHPVCLFQTNIPGFYEKLGAGIIENRFFNSKNLFQPQKRPWWNPNVMIYPKDAPWPVGDLDLNGPGF